MTNPVGRPPLYTDPEEMQVIIDAYFDHCRINRENIAGIRSAENKLTDPVKLITDDEIPTISGLGVVLGMDRRSVNNYAHDDKFFPTIKEAKSRIEGGLEQRLFHNNATGTIFNLKNNFSWNDKSEVDNTTRIIIGDKDVECG